MALANGASVSVPNNSTKAVRADHSALYSSGLQPVAFHFDAARSWTASLRSLRPGRLELGEQPRGRGLHQPVGGVAGWRLLDRGERLLCRDREPVGIELPQ